MLYVAVDLLNLIRSNPAGGTVDPVSLEAPDFGQDDFCVAIRGYEASFDSPSIRDIASWLEEALPVAVERGAYIGWWQENGRVVLDVSLIVPGRDEAIVYGLSQEQRGIYHPASGEYIDLRGRLLTLAA